jgi:hypothetical protein
VGNQLQQEWQTVSGAPFLTIGAVVVIGLALWAILHFLYRHRIEGMKEEIDRLRARAPTPPAKANPAPLSAPAARPAAKKKNAGAADNRKVELPPQPADRIFVGDNVTPRFLIDQYEGVTKMQGDRVAGAYIGKWMKISGTVKNVYPNGSVTIEHPDRKSVSMFSLDFKNDLERLEILHPGDRIDAIGQIQSLGQWDITLNDCEFIGS